MRMHPVSPWVAALALLAVACGSGSDSSQPSSPEPLQPTVSGLVVLGRSIAASSGDALGAPPAGWASGAESAAFDRAVAHADWTVTERPDMRGVTSADGSFELAGLPPGRYTLALTKTLDGNFVPVSIPFTVPASGEATVVAELELGLLRTVLRFTEDGQAVTEVLGPYGTRVLTRDGVITELGDHSRTYQDADGDGRFEQPDCSVASWLCGPGNVCTDGRLCACVASCPFCEDCPLTACVPVSGTPPYACAPDHTCKQPGERCVCVASCPECDDCAAEMCTNGCEPVEITSLTISALPLELVVGRETRAAAIAAFSDGSSMDVTHLAQWHSADPSVASVDSWGRVSARAVGVTEITATLGGLAAVPVPLIVVERPALQRITVENAACACGPVPNLPAEGGALPPPCLLDDGVRADLLPVPMCTGVVEIGRSVPLRAIGAFADGSHDDLTAVVEWAVTPTSVGRIDAGAFTALEPGTARISASLGSIVSDAIEIRVVAEGTVVALSIYPDAWSYTAVAGGPIADAAGAPCFECDSALSVLRGDTVQFRATAHYDTGEWREVTAAVTWRSSATDVAAVDAAGQMQAMQAGTAVVDATLDGVVSNPVTVRVVDHATLQTLSVHMEGTDRVVAIADQRFFRATGQYDVGFGSDVTEEATWRTSDDRIGTIDARGVFVGVRAGVVQVWAELDGQQSARISLEVYATSELAYCDPLQVNRTVWQDAFNRVVLESDCASYVPPQQVELRYTVTETQPHGGIFDPCLDLYVYQGDRRVRTIREEGCGDPFIAAGAPGRDEAVLKYQLRAVWDLKDDSGMPVAPGTYAVYGRFYLYYDPVVRLDVRVLSVDSSAPIAGTAATPQLAR